MTKSCEGQLAVACGYITPSGHTLVHTHTHTHTHMKVKGQLEWGSDSN